MADHVGETRELAITEGELKAAAASKYGLACIGLGGVWNFKSKQPGLIAGLAQIDWKGVTVRIVYDSDLFSNEHVLKAQNALARELANHGARVYVCCLPALPGIKKTGLDDYLVARGPEAFRREVLESAVLWAEHESLFRLNEEVLYVEDPGMILRRDTGQTVRCSDFVNHHYADRTYSAKTGIGTKHEKTVVKSTAREWLKWPYRARVNRLTYRPGEPEVLPSGKPRVADELNLWPGWGVEPVRGDAGPWRELLDFLFRAARPEDRRWFEQWVAYPIQNPGAKLYTAVLIWGRKHGTGKSLVGLTIGDLYGKNFAGELSHQDLFGLFNGWAASKQFALGEEIATGDTKNAEHVLKSLITRESVRINEKYQVPYTLPDCLNYLFTSNAEDALLVRNTDRRLFIHEVEGNETLPQEFYERYNKDWRQKEGLAHLMYHLQHLDLTGFQPHAPAPMTVAKADMIVAGRTDLQNWAQRLNDDPDATLPQHAKYSLYTTEELTALFDPNHYRRTPVRAVGIALSEYLGKAGRGKKPRVRGLLVAGATTKRALWIVRDKERLQGMTEAELAARYNKERTY